MLCSVSCGVMKEGMKVVMAYFQVLSELLSGGIEENYKFLSQDNVSAEIRNGILQNKVLLLEPA
jgi:hypothetical protein